MEIKEKEMFNGNDLAINVWKSKYAADGEVHYSQMHRRMAKEFARIEDYYRSHIVENPHIDDLSDYAYERSELTEDSIYELFKDFKYIIPQGSIMAGLGTGKIASLSNCFFIGQPEDSYSGIFEKDEQLAQLMKRRGGVGMDISTLRPSGVSVSNAAKTSTGAVSFMERYSNTTREVAQGGRRGALMLSMDVNHPDILDFIKIKRDLSKVTGANISVKVTNEFMEAVQSNSKYILKFPVDSELSIGKYDEYYPDWDNGELNYIAKDDCYVKVIDAKEYWNELIKSARNSAEPGILFWDRVLAYGLDSPYENYKPKGVNPCGEVTLSDSDSCRLIAVNLFSFVENPFTSDAYFDSEKFYKINYEAMVLSDDLVDLEIENVDRIIDKIKSNPSSSGVEDRELGFWEKIRFIGKNGRRTGLGITGLGDTLAALGLKYDSDDSMKATENIMRTKMKSELDCTIDLSILRGKFTE